MSSKQREGEVRLASDALQYPRCDVALEVVACSHDIIKNRIQPYYLDGTLAEWLEDGHSLADFETRLRSVVNEMSEYSPVVAARQLKPIAAMPEEKRAVLLARLGELFERGFAPAVRSQRMASIVDQFSLAVQSWRHAEGEDRSSELAAIKAAAVALRGELETLPAGFWLPSKEV